MNKTNEYFDDTFTPEEQEFFEEKFCRGTFIPRFLTEEEIEELKKQGRI